MLMTDIYIKPCKRHIYNVVSSEGVIFKHYIKKKKKNVPQLTKNKENIKILK